MRVNYCLAIPRALMKGGGKWALLTWAGNYSRGLGEDAEGSHLALVNPRPARFQMCRSL